MSIPACVAYPRNGASRRKKSAPYFIFIVSDGFASASTMYHPTAFACVSANISGQSMPFAPGAGRSGACGLGGDRRGGALPGCRIPPLPQAGIGLQRGGHPLPDAVVLPVVVYFRRMYLLFHKGSLLFSPVYAKADIFVSVAAATGTNLPFGVKYP